MLNNTVIEKLIVKWRMLFRIKECHKIAFLSSLRYAVIDAQSHAEVLHTNFIVEHNILFFTGGNLAPLYDQMFPDSKTAKDLPGSRTVTTSILKKAMAPLLHSALVDHIAENRVSIADDGSNNCGL